ncbi:MAG TPA: DUF58 domain-containing protein [Planococcus sp. (in: firmicutes)]|nr:DUF58 domain-containing protein [Planococcus sp. (in: firmicutes)]
MKQLKKLLELWGRLMLVLLILIITFSFAMFQGGFVSWFIFYMALPFILYSILLTFYPLQDITLSRSVHTGMIKRGDTFSATVHIHRKTPFPLLYHLLREQSHSINLRKRGVQELRKMVVPGFKRNYSWTYEINDMPRGEHVLEGVQVEISDFFGWVKKTALIPAQQTILVYPNTMEIEYRPIDSRYDQGTMAAPFTLVKDTTMATGIRDYRAGDRMSWIHWKSYARTQTMRTKEFEDRQSQDLFLLDDRASAEKYEIQVELVASILQSIVRSKSSVAYLSIGATRDHFPIIQTEEHLQRVMYYLTKSHADLDHPLSDAVNKELSQVKASSVLYVTGHLTVEMVGSIQRSMKQMTACMCLVVMDKGEKPSPEDEAVHRFARSRGFIVKLISPENFENVFREVDLK